MAAMLLAALLCVSAAQSPPVWTPAGFLPGSGLTGTNIDAGYARALGWGNVNFAPQSEWSTWCTTRPLNELVSAAFAARVNRCISNALGPSGFAVQGTNANRFTIFQYNGTHMEQTECADARCQTGCVIVTSARTLECRARSLLGGALSFIQGEEWSPDLFTLPSPTYCTRATANGDCTGEVLTQACLTQCLPMSSPTGALVLTRFQCQNGAIVAKTCPVGSTPLLSWVTCLADGCTGPPPTDLPTFPTGCTRLDISGYGYTTLGCTFSNAADANSAPITAFDCAGMSGQQRAQCTASTTSVDASVPRDIVGSWASANVADSTLTLRDPPLGGRSAMNVRGRMTPVGDLRVSFATRASLDAAAAAGALPLFKFSQPIVGSSTSFRSVVALVEGTNEGFCATQQTSASTLSVTVSTTPCNVPAAGSGAQGGQGGTAANRLSDGAIAGITVTVVAIVAAAVVALSVILYKRHHRAAAWSEMHARLNEESDTT